MKEFITQSCDRGEVAIPVAHIKKILIMNMPSSFGDWRVQLEFFHDGEPWMRLFKTEAKAREWYDYCQKQVIEWLDACARIGKGE